MSAAGKPAPVVLVVALLVLVAALTARAEVIQRHDIRVSFTGKLSPSALPRTGAAPITVSVGTKIATTTGADPPQLRKVVLAINANGRLDPGGLPRCRVEQIQPATTEGALEACHDSLVGRGSFSARILLPEQAPFPSAGDIYAFNGTYRGKPAILAHVYGTHPAPISYTLPFQITRIKGTYGTLLSASLPQVTSEWGYVTGLTLTLGNSSSVQGGRRPYLSAGCPAPKGFAAATFPLARANFGFAGGVNLKSTLDRSCTVRAG